MNTNNIKSFAKQARLILMEGVKQRLLYWGFDANGNCTETVEPTIGGYIFRTLPFSDDSVPPKWQKLKSKLTSKQAVQDTIEEAAYTWFNRLMAINILEKRGYIQPTLTYAAELKTPQIVQNAKRGQHLLKQQKYIDLLQQYLVDDQEEQALGLLLTRLCNNNILLHDVFGRIDDYTEILLPNNLLQRNGIIDLLNSDVITDKEYKEVELIGWLYQFYISDKKDEVFKGFKANKKARPEDIPAATQIFTPKWIVKYMVENTVGKIYLDFDKTSSLKPEMKYLVENEVVIPSAVEGQAQSRDEGLIHHLEELTLIDPASGSGHILVTGFELLFKMYREQGYTAKNAVISILQNNLYGLDIDDRAMQLARFAVLLKAAEFYPEILNASDSNPLVLPHIYSFPENTIDYIFAPEAISISRLKEYLDYQIAEDVVENWMEDFVDPDTGIVVTIDKSKTIIDKWEKVDEVAIEILKEHNITSVLINTYKPVSEFLETTEYNIVLEVAKALSLLRQGKNIGAALKLKLKPETLGIVEKQFQSWNTKQLQGKLDFLQTDLWNNLKPFLEVLLVMTKKYTAVVANPPYMGQKSMNAELKEYLQFEYPNSWNDLMTTFMEVNLNLLVNNGSTSIINIPSWMFLSTYEELRVNLLNDIYFSSVLHFGRGVFGSDFGSVSFTLVKNDSLKNNKGVYRGLYDKIGNVENIDIKENYFFNDKFKYFRHIQSEFLKIPQKTISYWLSSNALDKYKNKTIKDICPPVVGMMTSDNNRFVRYWQETSKNKIGFLIKDRHDAELSSYKWFPYNKGGEFRRWFGNNEYVVNWECGGRDIYNNGMTSFRGKNYYFKKGITWSFFGFNNFGVRYKDDGYIFDISGMSSFPSSDKLYFFIALLNSNVGFLFLQAVAPTVNFQANDVSSVPVEYPDNLSEIDKLAISSINTSRKDWNSRETSWDFEQSPLLNASGSLKEAYQKWQDKATQDFFQLHENEEELNSIFIDIYGLQEELTPEVALKDITILQDELDRNELEQLEPVFRAKGKEAVTLPIYKDEVISQFLSYSIGLFMGRYRLDKPGLHIAHPNPTEEELANYVIASPFCHSTTDLSFRGNEESQVTMEIDEDAIIPLMGSECAFPDDALVRIKNLIHDLWGETTLTENLNFVNECLGMDLDKWLTEKFWGYHTSMYKKKPIYWLFCSNPKKPQASAFKVLTYMHRMDKYTVSKIQRNYLHPHQEWIKHEIEKAIANESNLSKNELKRLEKLRVWELECRDYNEVLKTLALNEIVFDLDDGVSVNYEKFEEAVAKI